MNERQVQQAVYYKMLHGLSVTTQEIDLFISGFASTPLNVVGNNEAEVHAAIDRLKNMFNS